MDILTEEYKDYINHGDDENEIYSKLICFLEKMHILFDFISITPNISLCIRIVLDQNIKSSINVNKWLKGRLLSQNEDFVSIMCNYFINNIINELWENNQFWFDLNNNPTISKINNAKLIIPKNLNSEMIQLLLKLIAIVQKNCSKTLPPALFDTLKQINIIICCVRIIFYNCLINKI